MKKTARIYESAVLDEFVALENPELTAIVEKKMQLAAKIYEALQKQKISNRTFAERLNISPSLVTKWLSGQHNFTVDTLVKIERMLGIELLYAEKIAVEIKSFLKESFIYDFYEAFGQYLVYLDFLAEQDPERTLYLAVSEDVFARKFKDDRDVLRICRRYNVKILIIDAHNQIIEEWIR